MLGLDIGRQYLRGAVADLTGEVVARTALRTRASSSERPGRRADGLADELCARRASARSSITQTVIGSPGVYDPRRNAIALAGDLAGWGKPAVLAELREAFGEQLVVENDVDAATLAERVHGHGREVRHVRVRLVGTGIGMGLVIDGQPAPRRARRGGRDRLHADLGGQGSDPQDARRRGTLEASGSAAAVVRAARRAGMRGSVSARRVFEAAAAGDERAAAVVAGRGGAGSQGHLRDRHRGGPRARRPGRRYRPGARIRRCGGRASCAAWPRSCRRCVSAPSAPRPWWTAALPLARSWPGSGSPPCFPSGSPAKVLG